MALEYRLLADVRATTLADTSVAADIATPPPCARTATAYQAGVRARSLRRATT